MYTHTEKVKETQREQMKNQVPLPPVFFYLTLQSKIVTNKNISV